MNAVPLAFIDWLFAGLSKRIDNLTARRDRLYALLSPKWRDLRGTAGNQFNLAAAPAGPGGPR